MEIWQEEELYQMALEVRRQRRPRCVCCGEPVASQMCLDLSAFGLHGVACEDCIDGNLHNAEDVDS